MVLDGPGESLCEWCKTWVSEFDILKLRNPDYRRDDLGDGEYVCWDCLPQPIKDKSAHNFSKYDLRDREKVGKNRS